MGAQWHAVRELQKETLGREGERERHDSETSCHGWLGVLTPESKALALLQQCWLLYKTDVLKVSLLQVE